ncbi:MAG: Ig-like domain repeat protein [Ferruginibacter sp.]
MHENLPAFFNILFLRKACLLYLVLFFPVLCVFAGDPGKKASIHNSYIITAAPSTVAISVNTNPSCFGSNVTLTATVTPNLATGLVQFYDGAVLLGVAALSGGVATFSTSLLTAGSHSLTAVYGGDLNYTTSTSPVLVQSVDAATPATPGTISGLATVCPVTSQTYSVTAVANATVYNWTLPAGWVINTGTGTNSITVTTSVNSGNVSVTAGNACGTSAAQTKAVTANPPIPATPGTISGSASVCPSTTGIVYSITAVPNATSYTWTAPGTGWTVTSGAGTVSITYSTTAAAVSGNLSVAAVNGCGSSAASQTINISPVNATDNTGYTDGTTKFSDGITAATVTTPVRRGYIKFPLAALSVIPGTATITSILKLTNNGSGVSGAANFINALGTNDPVSTAAATLFNAAATGTQYFTGAWGNTGTISLTLNAAANADIQSSISSPGYIAMGLQKALTGTAIANFWGYSSGANVPVLAVTYASLRTLAITVNPPKPVAPGTITGPSSVCPNSIGNVYSVTAVANATTYTWTVPAGWTITSGATTNSITVTSTATGGNISVTAGNSCGTSTSSPAYAVSIGILPTVSASPISQETCSGMPIGTITCSNPNAIAGTTYSWIRDNAAITGMGFTGTTPSTITGSLTNLLTTQQTTNFTIYAVSGIGCYSASPVTVSVSVNANPVADAGIDQSGCAAVSVPIGGTPTASGGTPGYTYLWSAGVSNTAIANPTAPPGTYTVTVTDSKGCVGTDAITISVGGSGTKTWIGSGTAGGGPDNNFNNAANWSPAGVPGACNDVIINMDIYNIFNVFSGTLNILLNSSVTIKSLSIDIGGTTAFSSASNFKLYAGSNTLNILNNTSLNTHTTGFFSAPAGGFISVGPGGVISYGGNLTTLQSNNCQNYPFYADVNNTGKMYLNGDASLAGIGNDPNNKPAQVIFNGTGTQTISNNSGTQPIYLAASTTMIGQTNSPTVVLSGTGTNGFRNIGDLDINNTSTLDIGTTQSMNRNAAGGTINMAAGSFMKLGRNNGGVGSSNFPSNFSSFNFNATSTVDYNAAAGQTVFATPLYGNLNLSTSGNKTITGNTTVQKNITIQGAAIMQGGTYTTALGGNWTNYGQVGFSEQTSTVDFNGSGAQSINTTGGDVFYTLNKTGAGTTTLLSDVAVQGGGTSSFTLSNGTFDAGTFSFNSAASSFNISSGLLKLARTGATQLPEFAIASYNLTGGTIELYGAGDQVLRGSRAYRNLTFSTSGIKTVSSAITSITGTILTQNSVTLDVSNNTMGGAGTNLTMTGTSLYKTAGTATKPDAQGTYTLGTGTTVEFTNTAAATTEDVRLSAPTYYNLVVSGTNVANSSLGTGIKMQAGGTFTVKNGGLFKLGNSTGFSGGAATSVANTNSPAIVLEDGSTVEYYGGPAGTNAQTVTNVLPYYHLNFSGTSVKTAPATILTVKGNLSNNNSGFAHNNGTLLLGGTAAQDYNSAGTTLAWYNLTASNPVNVNVNGDLSVANLLSLSTAGKLNLLAGNITLRSSAAGTAAVDKILLANSIAYGGTGRFIVERFIATGTAHAKSWQFLATPAFGSTVNASWQEGNAPLIVGTAGLGTTLSSEKTGAVSRGYDFYTAPGPSIKTYNTTNGLWDGIDDGTTATSALQLANSKGYMVLVRGDRSVQTSATAANPTTLRTRGKLYTPGTDAPASITVAPAKFGTAGNPYASAIDFTNVSASSPGIDTKYYLWDPLLIGSNGLGLGAYQTISSVTGWAPMPGGTANYPSGVPYTKIQSGQAFFVFSTPGGTLNFNENNKLTGSQSVFRLTNDSARQFLNTYLYNTSGNLADGNTVAFDPMFSNDFDSDDALKLNNASENLGIAHSNNILSVDARMPVTNNDTVFYNISGLRVQPYQFKIVPHNMQIPGQEAFFVDRYTGTNTQVSLTDTNTIDFNITTDAASFAPDRFFVVFRVSGTVPVTLLNVSANRLTDRSAMIKWNVENEINMDHYEIERSINGRNFVGIGSVVARSNNGIASLYNYQDVDAPATDIFYRIKAMGSGNYIRYSNIVKVAGINTNEHDITIYPNPVKDGMAHIYFRNQPAGIYKLQLSNKLGEIIYSRSITVVNDDQVESFPVGKGLAGGSYQLSIIAPKGTKQYRQLIIE